MGYRILSIHIYMVVEHIYMVVEHMHSNSILDRKESLYLKLTEIFIQHIPESKLP